MTTISLLKDIKEIKDIKIKVLPTYRPSKCHPDINWLRNEYYKWSQQYPGLNTAIDNYLVILIANAFGNCHSKEMLLAILMAMDISFNIDNYLLTARTNRSAEMAVDIIAKLLEAMKTGECADDFIPGKRLVDSLKPLKSRSTERQWVLAENYLELGLKAHLDIHCNYWLKRQFIPLKDYVDKRVYESFSCWLIFMTEYSINFTLTDTIRDHIMVKEFTAMGTALALALDDYYVAKSKILHNDITNRIVCVLNEKGCSLEEAFHNQFEYILGLDKCCNELIDKINANPEIASDQLKQWLDSVYVCQHSLFTTLTDFLGMQIKSDRTVYSLKWDQAYNDLIAKGQASVDPWDLDRTDS